jgi:YD repeat-containing protein
MIAILDPCDRITVFEYDYLNQQSAKYMPFVFTDPTPANDICVEDIYSALAVASLDAEYWDYDYLGRLEAHTDYKDQAAGYFYNALGRLEYKRHYQTDADYVSDPNNNWKVQYKYTYDNLGRTTEVEQKDNPNTYTRTTTYVYDAEGRIETITTPQGDTNYAHDSITGQKFNASSTNTATDYYYDGLGRLQTVYLTERNGQTVDEKSDYTYNEIGSRQSLQYANGNYTYYGYDALNRLTSLTNFEQFEADPQAPTGSTLSEFEYYLYADGTRQKAVEKILPKDGIPGTTPLKSQTIVYTYDNLNRLILEDANEDGTNGYSVEYEYDLVGNKLNRAVWFDHRADELYTKYEHNDKDQLIRETHSDSILSARLGRPDSPYYAYAESGGVFYTRADNKDKIGPFKAWWLGLPSAVSQWLFGLVMALLAVAFLVPALVHILARIRGRQPTTQPFFSSVHQ